MADVTKIYQTEAILPDRPDIKQQDKRKNKQRKTNRAAKKHFQELSKIIEETHRELVDADSPFRLCIYQEGEDIYIDVVTLDGTGKTAHVFRHDISDFEVENLVHQIKSKTGLLLDADA